MSEESAIVTKKSPVVLFTDADYELAAQRGSVGISRLSREERLAVLSMRLQTAADAFVKARGAAAAWNALQDAMCAMQEESNRNR